MSIEPIGLVTLAIGLICLMRGSGPTVIAFSVFPVLGGAAALLLGSTGIQPGHFFLGFLILSTFWLHGDPAMVADRTLRSPAFVWLVLLVVYGVLAGYFAPRLLEGTMEIIPLGTSASGTSEGKIPLMPVSGNFTQAVYLTADLVTFGLILSIASTQRSFRHVTLGVLAFGIANVFFGIADLLSPGTPIADLFSYIRNSTYTFHADEMVAGMRRIIGSWPEASAFAGASMAVVGFCGTLWICGRHSAMSGLLFALSTILIIRSTSSGGIAGLPICLAILYLTSLLRCGGASGTRASLLVVIAFPVVALMLGFVLALNRDLFQEVYRFVDITILSKPASLSALERGSWNASGLSNFWDSYGFGVGLGTVRTSSFAVALLSNVGVFGTIFFLAFLLTAVIWPRGEARSYEADVGLAARNGCLCLIVGALISGSTVDLGLIFFIMAGLRSAVPEASPSGSQSMAIRSVL